MWREKKGGQVPSFPKKLTKKKGSAESVKGGCAREARKESAEAEEGGTEHLARILLQHGAVGRKRQPLVEKKKEGGGRRRNIAGGPAVLENGRQPRRGFERPADIHKGEEGRTSLAILSIP